MTKGKVFLLCWGAVMVIFIFMFAVGILKNNLDIIPVEKCLVGIGSLAGLYIAGSVANNGVKGHNWNQDMYDSENKLIVGGGSYDGTQQKNAGGAGSAGPAKV